MRKLTLVISILLSLLYSACTGDSKHYDNPMAKLSADSQQASQRIYQQTKPIIEFVDQLNSSNINDNKQPNKKSNSSQQSLNNMQDYVEKLVATYIEEKTQIEEDISINKTKAEETYQQAVENTKQIQDPVMRKTELKRLEVAKQRVDRYLQQTHNQMLELQTQIVQAKDLAIVASNSRAIGDMVRIGNDIKGLSNKAQSLLVELATFSRDKHNKILDIPNANADSSSNPDSHSDSDSSATSSSNPDTEAGS